MFLETVQTLLSELNLPTPLNRITYSPWNNKKVEVYFKPKP